MEVYSFKLAKRFITVYFIKRGLMPKIIIIVGVVLVIIGVIWMVFPGAFSWFGKLPGDIRYESGNTRVYPPVSG